MFIFKFCLCIVERTHRHTLSTQTQTYRQTHFGHNAGRYCLLSAWVSVFKLPKRLEKWAKFCIVQCNTALWLLFRSFGRWKIKLEFNGKLQRQASTRAEFKQMYNSYLVPYSRQYTTQYIQYIACVHYLCMEKWKQFTHHFMSDICCILSGQQWFKYMQISASCFSSHPLPIFFVSSNDINTFNLCA